MVKILAAQRGEALLYGVRHSDFTTDVLFCIGLVANLYSRLGVDPSLAIYAWDHYIKARVRHLQHRFSKARDVEDGESPGVGVPDHPDIPQQRRARAGYGVVGAVMLPAIL